MTLECRRQHPPSNDVENTIFTHTREDPHEDDNNNGGNLTHSPLKQ